MIAPRNPAVWVIPPQPIWRRVLVAIGLLPPPSIQVIPFEIDIDNGEMVADIPEGTKIVRVQAW